MCRNNTNTTEQLVVCDNQEDPETEIRGYASILLGNLAANEAEEDLKILIKDTEDMELYRDGAVEKRTVGQLASEALDKL